MAAFFFQIRKCKEDFIQSLSGIQTVTTKFLNKIDNLFPHSLTFHLTCKSQKEQLETIKSNCTNLSRDVENKFQPYLDHVGEKVRECRLVYPESIKRLKKKNNIISALKTSSNVTISPGFGESEVFSVV